MEWAMARYSQVIPCNWSYKQAINWVPDCAPIGFLVADAQNMAVARFMEEDCDWMLFIEHDNVLPPDCFLRLNEYVTSEKYPIVSGLYFTKTYP